MSPRQKLLPLLLALGLAGGAATVPATTGHAAAKAVVRVAIQDFAFNPATLKIKAGTTVIWTNKDAMAHTVTATNGRWGSHSLAQGQTYTYTFKKAGTYAYDCAVHPSMTARVIVAK